MKSPSTALLVLDVQVALVAACPDAPAAIPPMTEAISKARKAGVPVLYGSVRLRPGHSDVSDRNDMFVEFARSGALDEGTPTAQFHQAIAPSEEDITFVKRRFSAFTGSDLDIILRSLRIEDVVLLGLSTSGVVLSTLLEAADRDYRVSILSDACADPDEELHRVLVSKVFPAQAKVLTASSWMPETTS